LDAIGTILRALEGLDGDSIQRVFDYIIGRLSIGQPGRVSVQVPTAVVGGGHATTESAQVSRQLSIRDLKEQKQPESSNQMTALVAFYLSEIASESERKESITSSEVEKYFKQAGFKLPKSIQQTLPNAAAAGYFDAEGNGRYRLNPVGYNLVAHGLPREQKTIPYLKGPKKKRGRR
jgi:hypothetical protein